MFEPCFLLNLILAFIGIVFKMTHIRYIPDIADPVTQVKEITVEQVECHRRTGMAEMSIAVHRRSADIQSDKRGVQRTEYFSASGKAVVY
jgi:hypothetical protein